MISAVSGGRDAVVDGQVALAEAAQRSGARRIVPSAFSLDFMRTAPGEYPLFDVRREAYERIAELGMEQVHVLQGSFMDLFVPGEFVIDRNGAVDYWGDGTERLQVTSVEDTARVTARVALDPEVPSGFFRLAGDEVSILSAAAEVERRTGRALRRRRLGSAAELRAALDQAREGPDPVAAAVLAFHLLAITGDAALQGLEHERYPDLQLERFAEFADRAVAG